MLDLWPDQQIQAQRRFWPFSKQPGLIFRVQSRPYHPNSPLSQNPSLWCILQWAISIWLYGGLEPIWNWYNGLYTADIECSLSMLNAHLTCMDYHPENIIFDRVRTCQHGWGRWRHMAQIIDCRGRERLIMPKKYTSSSECLIALRYECDICHLHLCIR